MSPLDFLQKQLDELRSQLAQTTAQIAGLQNSARETAQRIAEYEAFIASNKKPGKP